MSSQFKSIVTQSYLLHIRYITSIPPSYHLVDVIMIIMVLIGDKAYNTDDEMKGVLHPHIAVHGSFSLMVNYGALCHYIDNKGGFSMVTPYCDGFKVACFATGVNQVRGPRLIGTC
jgi:hypothetical protein